MTEMRQSPSTLIAEPGRVRRGTLVGGALTAGALTVGALRLGGASAARAASPSQDIRILNFALLLEEIEVGFYAAARDAGNLRGEYAEFAETVAGQEREHVAFLRDTLGAKAGKSPRLQFGQTITSEKRFTAAAITLEDIVVAAYNGQATNLSPSALGAAARIVSVEARHAAWIRAIAGKPPADKPTDAAAGVPAVMATIKKLGFLR